MRVLEPFMYFGCKRTFQIQECWNNFRMIGKEELSRNVGTGTIYVCLRNKTPPHKHPPTHVCEYGTTRVVTSSCGLYTGSLSDSLI